MFFEIKILDDSTALELNENRLTLLNLKWTTSGDSGISKRLIYKGKNSINPVSNLYSFEKCFYGVFKIVGSKASIGKVCLDATKGADFKSFSNYFGPEFNLSTGLRGNSEDGYYLCHESMFWAQNDNFRKEFRLVGYRLNRSMENRSYELGKFKKAVEIIGCKDTGIIATDGQKTYLLPISPH